jgi:hypothetical protein
MDVAGKMHSSSTRSNQLIGKIRQSEGFDWSQSNRSATLSCVNSGTCRYGPISVPTCHQNTKEECDGRILESTSSTPHRCDTWPPNKTLATKDDQKRASCRGCSSREPSAKASSGATSFDFLISFLVPAACSRTTRLGSCLINQTLQGRHSIGRRMRTQLQGRRPSAAPTCR